MRERSSTHISSGGCGSPLVLAAAQRGPGGVQIHVTLTDGKLSFPETFSRP